MIVMLNPGSYRKYVIYDSNGNPELFVLISKVLYGLLKSALLFYLKLSKDLKTWDL